jgi:hypothetical protein
VKVYYRNREKQEQVEENRSSALSLTEGENEKYEGLMPLIVSKLRRFLVSSGQITRS